MSNFTKGRWEADTLYGDHYVVFANGHVVADCFKNADNAQLIAEAPAMYELLNRTLDFFVEKDIDSKLKHDIDYCILRANGSPLQCVYERERKKNNGEV